MRALKMLRIFLFSLLCLPSCSRETEEREKVIGYMGLARRNPYLAAERYLEAGGKQVTQSMGVLELAPEQALVIAPASTVRSVGDAQRVLDWVAEGGHFVCIIDRGEEYWEDVGDGFEHEPDRWLEEFDEQPGIEYLVSAVDLELVDAPFYDEGCISCGEADEEASEADQKVREQERLEVARGEHLPNADSVTLHMGDGASLKVRLGGARAIGVVDEVYRKGDWYDIQDEHRFFSRLHGYDAETDQFLGRLTLMSDARLLRNPYLGMDQHVDLLDRLANTDGEVVFSLGRVRGFLSLLGEHGAKALWALLAFIVLWLWKYLPRFGPLLDIEHGHSRAYATHLNQVGHFYWRYKRADVLVEAVRGEVRRKLGERVGAEAINYDELAQRCGLDVDSVRLAMECEVRDNSGMVRTTKNLQKILNTL